MIIPPAAFRSLFPVESGSYCHIDFAAYDRFDPRFFCFFVIRNHAEHISVFRQGYGIHIQIINGIDKLIDALGTIQQAVIRVVM